MSNYSSHDFKTSQVSPNSNFGIVKVINDYVRLTNGLRKRHTAARGQWKHHLTADGKHHLMADGKHHLTADGKHQLMADSKHHLTADGKNHVMADGIKKRHMMTDGHRNRRLMKDELRKRHAAIVSEDGLIKRHVTPHQLPIDYAPEILSNDTLDVEDYSNSSAASTGWFFIVI